MQVIAAFGIQICIVQVEINGHLGVYSVIGGGGGGAGGKLKLLFLTTLEQGQATARN